MVAAASLALELESPLYEAACAENAPGRLGSRTCKLRMLWDDGMRTTTQSQLMRRGEPLTASVPRQRNKRHDIELDHFYDWNLTIIGGHLYQWTALCFFGLCKVNQS